MQVAGNLINFNVDLVACLEMAKGGMGEGVGDDGDAEVFIVNVVDGQADAVHAYRTFDGDERSQRGGQRKLHDRTEWFRLDGGDGGHGINVAADQVSIEAVAKALRTAINA